MHIGKTEHVPLTAELLQIRKLLQIKITQAKQRDIYSNCMKNDDKVSILLNSMICNRNDLLFVLRNCQLQIKYIKKKYLESSPFFLIREHIRIIRLIFLLRMFWCEPFIIYDDITTWARIFIWKLGRNIFWKEENLSGLEGWTYIIWQFLLQTQASIM